MFITVRPLRYEWGDAKSRGDPSAPKRLPTFDVESNAWVPDACLRRPWIRTWIQMHLVPLGPDSCIRCPYICTWIQMHSVQDPCQKFAATYVPEFVRGFECIWSQNAATDVPKIIQGSKHIRYQITATDVPEFIQVSLFKYISYGLTYFWDQGNHQTCKMIRNSCVPTSFHLMARYGFRECPPPLLYCLWLHCMNSGPARTNFRRDVHILLFDSMYKFQPIHGAIPAPLYLIPCMDLVPIAVAMPTSFDLIPCTDFMSISGALATYFYSI